MDFDEIFEMFDLEPDDGDAAPDPPTFRATIRGSRLTIVAWMPHLLTQGPVGKLVRERAQDGVTLADLWVTDEEPTEAIVRYLAVADRRRADRLISRWAEAVGHSRLWLPDRLVEFDPARPLGSAKVECPTCGAGWQDSGPEFWETVRKSGRFPSLCPLCNSDLPQWRWWPGRPGRRAPGASSQPRHRAS